MEITTAKRLEGISEYYFSQKLREIDELNKAGKNIISLGIGSPDLPPHPDVIKVLREESAKPNVHAYQSYKGSPVLRNALKPASDPLFGTAPASGSYNATNDPKLRYTDPNNPGTTIANPLAQQMQVVARIIEASGNADVSGGSGFDFSCHHGFQIALNGGIKTHRHQCSTQNRADLSLAHPVRYRFCRS